MQHAHDSAKGTQGIKLQDVGSLQAGARHQLSRDPIPTPQSILDGSYQAALQSNERDVVTYVPRLPQHSGAPSLPSIVFCVNGKPGPYLNDITKKRVILDGAYDLVLKDRVWKQTSLTIDVRRVFFFSFSGQEFEIFISLPSGPESKSARNTSYALTRTTVTSLAQM